MTILQDILNDEINLYLRTWNFHWNVEGPLFPSLHAMFEEQYVQSRQIIDELAERMRALGAAAETDARIQIAGITRTPEMLRTLAEAHEAISKKMREQAIPQFEEAKDPGTADILTGFVELHDKSAWMLRATAM